MNSTGMIIRLLILILVTITHIKVVGQGFYFGAKGGINLANQKWNQGDRGTLVAGHGDIFMESIDPNLNGAIGASIGLHTRGSSIQYFNSFTNQNFTDGYRFNNAVLELYAKKRIFTDHNYLPYYMVGARLEYNVGNNLDEYERDNPNSLFHPIPVFVNDFTYGITFGVGIELLVSNYFQPALEFRYQQDIGYQYRQGAIPNVENPYTGQLINIPARDIRNNTFCISLVVKFLREVIYE